MCGITGWIDLAQQQNLGSEVLDEMVASLTHRGPDQSGTLFDGPVALGHRRLSIIDLEHGSQPITDKQGNLMVFNGEIYNYVELQRELEELGEWFEGHSDTEVLLAAYRRWGLGCLDRLVGMFAFALYDRTERVLILARDRLGKKPLYYHENSGFLAFGSEIKSLLSLPFMRGAVEVDHRSLSDFLSLGYILSPKTIFSNIRQLPAGHLMIKKGQSPAQIRSYWDLAQHFQAPKLTAEQALEEGRALLEDAVKLRLRSDVPLGSFLSGGLDSSSVVSLVHQFRASQQKAFCISFSQNSFDEGPYARELAEHWGVDLELQNFASPSRSELSKMVYHFDQPFSDNSLVATYQVNRLAAPYAKVALSGDGADEILAGYPTYHANRYYRWYSRIPRPFQEGMHAAALRWLSPSNKKLGLDYKLTQFLGSKGLSPEKAHYWWRNVFSPKEKRGLLRPEVLKSLDDYDPFSGFAPYWEELGAVAFLDRSLYVDIKTWLQDDILVKADRMSMAHSVEVRSPFLDHRFVEFCARVDSNLKLGPKQGKLLLRRIMGEQLPKNTLKRSKQGFSIPELELKADLKQGAELLPEEAAGASGPYKSFALLILGLWYDILAQYNRTGKWGPVDYE